VGKETLKEEKKPSTVKVEEKTLKEEKKPLRRKKTRSQQINLHGGG